MSEQKKEKKRSDEFRQTLWFVIAGLLISLMLIAVFSRVIARISATMTYDTTMSVKKNMLQEYVNNMITYLEEEREEYLLHYPDATEDEIEEVLLQAARKRIYGEHHEDGAYMWIQKVLNYDGGDDYAIRLIHPNLSDTEGCYLSTNEVNQMGMKAYEEELVGVRENGEIYLNYAFKKLNSNEVTEKVTFSKLYPRYDWIVCMGVNIDDLGHYRLQAQEHMRAYEMIILASISVTWLILLFLMLFVYRKTHIKAFEKKNKELKDKLNWDALTNANSRSYGEKQLEREFGEFKGGKLNTLVLMMDVDFFKQFNDNYGHDVGDQVLRSFVAAIKGCTRASDSVIRWGGDEFVVILQNIPHRFQPEIGDKILDAIRAIEIPELNGERQITASMGFAYFNDSDNDYKETLARADEALYEAKESGRNNWKIK
ncbi:MAG: diguanylate cyclase [Lachnospiraceae bacterium]|nr:diguanylate cyclase [Lachnospiraceae bacterium]